jgi:16S rRNA (guanine527-N7)-methyltransferase
VPSCESADAPFAALARDAERVGVHLDAATLALCARYADLVIERNTTMNLTAITVPADIATKHFLDSFTAVAVRKWTGRERIVDVGSGAGFPGLALRIALPGTRVTLVESMGKKARFLEEVTSTLAIDGVEIRNERAEALAHERRERYDVGTARAVGTLGAIVEYLLPFLRLGGDAIAWKGRLDAELNGARKACTAIGGEIVKITPTSELGLGAVLPGRSLVVIRKLRATPSRYPRSAAEVKRRPW